MDDVSGKLPISHDFYFKKWGLSNPSLDRYDTILVDESQDSNPVVVEIISSIIARGKQQVILVGDRFQSIYGWRGATSAMESFPNLDVKYLTASFRFPQHLADMANKLLIAMGSPKTLTGLGSGTNVETSAMLVRNNLTLIKEMQHYASEGLSMYVEADLKELWSAIYTANAMKYASFIGKPDNVEWPTYPNKAIKSHKTWENLEKCEDGDAKRIVSLVKTGFSHKQIQEIKCHLATDKD